MKKINFKCTICGSIVRYNKKLENPTIFTCSTCHAEYDESIFKSSKKRNSRIYFKKYGFILAIVSALYLIFLVYRILIY
ncbi:hypothetical protein LCGC14_0863520 [marine sediment metagenome]|uniref:Uncharacterized protein n=1 Tax=marine sediment metagenome TaxID=412755 RepID=A0A0F9P6P9_9ZZZZ